MTLQHAGYYSKPAYKNEIKYLFPPLIYLFHLEQSWNILVRGLTGTLAFCSASPVNIINL